MTDNISSHGKKRLYWVIGNVLCAILALVVFVTCVWTNDTQCASISAIVGIAALCGTAWHGLIYIAGRRAGL